MTTFTNTNQQPEDLVAPPPQVYRSASQASSSSKFRESFASQDAVQEEKMHPLERSGTMTSVQFLVAHEQRRQKPGYISERKPILAGLIKPPTVRQFIHEDQLYTEEQDRSVTQFELFADLVFVAIVHILGEVAAEEPNIFNVIRFILILWPPWSIWADMRSYINVSGTDDFIQRVYILFTSILLIGYTAQAAALEVEVEVEGAGAGAEVAAVEGTEVAEGLERSIFVMSDQGYKALEWAVAFFLMAKLVRLLLTFWYAWALPKFRTAHLVQSVAILVPCIGFLPLFGVRSVRAAVSVFTIGVVLEIVGKYVAARAVSWFKARDPRNVFIPAQEIGHAIEKTSAFFVLVSGEILIGVAYIARQPDEIGLSMAFGRAALGVILGFLLAWLYFDADSSRFYIHALRRHWWTSISWTQLHLPLSGAIVIVAAAMKEMIETKEISQGHRWYFGVGMGIAMLCLAGIGFLHRSLDEARSTLLRRWIRLTVRIIFAIFFITFPLVPNNNAMFDLGINTAFLALLVIAETVGKISLKPPQGAAAGIEEGNSKEARARAAGFSIDDLTPYEKGEDDIDNAGSVGLLRTISLQKNHRKAFASAV